MMIACVLSPRKNDSMAVAANSPSTALRNWRPSTASALTRWVRTALGPYRSNRADASALDRPAFRGVEPQQYLRDRCGGHPPGGERHLFIVRCHRLSLLVLIGEQCALGEYGEQAGHVPTGPRSN